MNASETSLLRAWWLMMTLSIALAVAAEPARPQRFRLVWAAFICIVAFWKARIVLSTYLGLRAAPVARGGFSSAVAVILALVLGSFALQPIVAMLR